MADSSIDVQYVANLARLKLSPEDVGQFQKQLSDILGYVNLLQQADVSPLDQSSAASVPQNNLRADVEAPSFPVETALSNAPLQSNHLIQLPKIVE